MIKALVIAVLVVSATALGTAATCSPAITNCTQCSTDGSTTPVAICVTCNTGLSLPTSPVCVTQNANANGASGCSTYIAGCTSCTAAAPTTCATCSGTYYLYNGTCYSCGAAPPTGLTGTAGPGCNACTISGTAVTCTGCLTGYANQQVGTAGCVNCATGMGAGTIQATNYIANSAGCSVASYTGGVLTLTTSGFTCNTGYYADTGSCANFGTGRGTNNAQTSVTSFATNLNAACTGGTVSSPGANGVLTCTGCIGPNGGWVLDGSTCVACGNATVLPSGGSVAYTGSVTGCSTCTTGGSGNSKTLTCSACTTGYVFNSGACVSCSSGTQTITGIPNCASCTLASTTLTCTSCNSGFNFYYNSTCIAAPTSVTVDPNCMVFAAPNHCVTCSSSTIFSSTGLSNSCVQCPANCAYCSSASTCNVCSSGYKLSSTTTGACVPSGASIIVPGFALLSIIFYFLF